MFFCSNSGAYSKVLRPRLLLNFATGTTRRCFSSEKKEVYIIGVGRTPVTRNIKDVSLEGMGGDAIRAALSDAALTAEVPTALFVGNMLSGMLSNQQHMGPLLADASGMSGVEALTMEACCGAGGAALRMGYMAIASGFHDVVVVAGVEHMTHVSTAEATPALASASHWPSEGALGETFASLNAQLMKIYMERYNVPHSAFAPFSCIPHANALLNPGATLHKAVTPAMHSEGKTIAEPVRLFDASPICDGSAAVVLTSNRYLALAAATSFASGSSAPSAPFPRPLVRIVGSGAATDRLAVAAREDPLELKAVARSAQQALTEAGLLHTDVDVFEAHDAYTIMAALSLENAGFVPKGTALQFAADGGIELGGQLPIATFGGLKARGHPVGATGVYQAVEGVLQLTGAAGDNQVKGAEVVMTQNIGGSGASVFAHVMVAGE